DSGTNATTLVLGSLTVEPALGVVVAPSRGAWDEGQALPMVATVHGGTGWAQACTWLVNGTATGSAQPCNLPFNISGGAGAPTTVQVLVTDSTGTSAESPLVALTPLQAPIPSVIQTASNASALHRAGGLEFNVSIAGGSAPFSIAWAIDGLNVSGAASDSLVWIPGSPQNVTAVAWVTDAANVTVASLPVTARGGVVELGNGSAAASTPAATDETGWYVAGLVAAAAVALIILLLIFLQGPRRPPRPAGRPGPAPRSPPRRAPPTP
ncbi:MAG TPA: hypothetical protein VMH90_01475, partial [Thermoplasmata archaeon]|nr:hypothetical protein [Thermoplasmata archaeon]